MSATKAVKRKHWYHVTYDECVLCGRTDVYRERVYGRKPKDSKRRYTFTQYACDYHFL